MSDNAENGKNEQSSGNYKVITKRNNVLPLWGNERTMNLNPLILTNIQSSHYFKVNLYELKTYHEVIDEIYFKVNHLEPWEKGSRKTAGQTGMCGGVRGVGAGGIVSTAFCLLYKLFTLKLSRKQVIGLITHQDSPYIRVLGFMYIRYTQPPADLWDWYEEYLDDPEELDVKAGGGQVMTIGNILKNFLCKLEWFSTLFPRIPVPIQQKLEKKMSERYPQVGPVPKGLGGNPIPFNNKTSDNYARGSLDRPSNVRRSRSREEKRTYDECATDNHDERYAGRRMDVDNRDRRSNSEHNRRRSSSKRREKRRPDDERKHHQSSSKNLDGRLREHERFRSRSSDSRTHRKEVSRDDRPREIENHRDYDDSEARKRRKHEDHVHYRHHKEKTHRSSPRKRGDESSDRNHHRRDNIDEDYQRRKHEHYSVHARRQSPDIDDVEVYRRSKYR